MKSKQKKSNIINHQQVKGLLDLPYEMTSQILNYLPEHEIFWNVGFTCKRLMEMALDTIKIIDLCESHIDQAKINFNEMLKHEDIVQSVRHIWICSDLDQEVRKALKKVLKDSREQYNILVIDYRLLNNCTSRQIGTKFTQLESLLMPRKHRGSKRLTNRSVRNIITSCKKLEWIDLRDCTELDFLSSRNVVSLIGENCKYLECILLSRCNFTNESIKAVFTNCNHLEMVIMNECSQVTDESLMTLAHCCLSLKLLCVDDCTNVTDQAISVIAKECRVMEEFSLRNTKVTDVSIKVIGQSCPELRVLNVRRCNITAESIQVIARNCRKLENLDLTKISRLITIECLREIASNCLSLKRLHLGFRSIWHRLIWKTLCLRVIFISPMSFYTPTQGFPN
jgi:predicted transport protein